MLQVFDFQFAEGCIQPHSIFKNVQMHTKATKAQDLK